MILSTETEVIGERLGDEAAIKILCEAGFEALDYSMFTMHDAKHPLNNDGYKEYALNLKKLASEYGVSFNQAHAPFPSCVENGKEYNKITFDRIIRAMEVASILDVKIIIVHPIDISDKTVMKQFNLDFFNSLKPYCEKFNIKVALENMWGWDKEKGTIIPNICSTGEMFCDYLDALDSRFFTACLDLGHCGLVGDDAAKMIRELGHDRLKALHVHDNDFLHDSHTAPFVGKMDWEAITSALAEINYDGDFTFEADFFYNPFPNDLLPVCAKFLHDIGRHLISRIVNL
ncbi:MAG: hypothetical protein A2Y15_01740 [Clostridiales bacterium GWF2_36_10]|nr:MAG: hypothetical protein A2Y15_01740 [Clostridiales bacterium GWF2_36_10]